MRPASIIWFERLFLFTLLIGVVQAAIGWDELRERGSGGELTALLALTFATLGGLALLVSRGRSRQAKWLLVLMCLLGLPLYLVSLEQGTIVGWGLLSVVQAALQAASLGLLFTAGARAWLSAKG